MTEETKAIAKADDSPRAQEVIARYLQRGGDISGWSEAEQNEVYALRAAQLGLNPADVPFDLIETRAEGGRTRKVLYPNKRAAAQLARNHGVSTTIVSAETVGNNHRVVVRATDATGRSVEASGLSTIVGYDRQRQQAYPLYGANLENAMLRAETKAVRRAILECVGDGLPLGDEGDEGVRVPPALPQGGES